MPETHKHNPLFADLGVRPETVAALENVGISRAFAIQELTLPIALAGDDLIGQARTGTGKTLGFGIPLIDRVKAQSDGASGKPQALVVVPTRELCIQVSNDLDNAGATRKIRVLSIYGGRAYEPQVEALKKGVDVIVGTPGRLLDLAQQGILKLNEVSILVLDEADEMLDLGFLPDVEKILTQLPDTRQTMLFSATMPGPVVLLARQFMNRPIHVRAESPDELQTVPTVTQFAYRVHAMDKVEMLARLLQAKDRGRTMVFCRTKRAAQKASDELAERGFAAASVHGDLGQDARERALKKFRSGKVDVLVATDVAARGIDVGGVTHVVNFHCPEDEKTFLHRVGRTGRAGDAGVAVTFVDWEELARWQSINKLLELPFADPEETYSTSEHLFTDLGIPEGSTGWVRTPEPAEPREVTKAVTRAPKDGKPTRRRTRRGKPTVGADVESTSHKVAVASPASAVELPTFHPAPATEPAINPTPIQRPAPTDIHALFSHA